MLIRWVIIWSHRVHTWEYIRGIMPQHRLIEMQNEFLISTNGRSESEITDQSQVRKLKHQRTKTKKPRNLTTCREEFLYAQHQFNKHFLFTFLL